MSQDYQEEMAGASGAGILFTDGIQVLAGYHPSLQAWSGIGGKTEEGETPQATAIRECCEEVFGLKPDDSLILEMAIALPLGEPTLMGDYALFRAEFPLLLTLSDALEKSGYTCQFYQSFPKTLSSLIEARTVPETAEVQALTFMPLQEAEGARESLAPEFYKDILTLTTSNA